MVVKYNKTGTTISEQKGRPKEKDLTHEDYKENTNIKKIPSLPQGTTEEKVNVVRELRLTYPLRILLKISGKLNQYIIILYLKLIKMIKTKKL